MGRRKSISVDAILDAAEALVVERGLAHLSLNMVAERADVSKGGLTYSFPTKEALLKAMAERDIARFDALVEEAVERGPQDPFPEIPAQLEVMRSEDAAVTAKAATMCAQLVQTEAERQAVRDWYRGRYDAYAGESDAHRSARVAFAAIEGVFFLRGLGFIELSDAEWAGLLDDIRHVYLKAGETRKR